MNPYLENPAALFVLLCGIMTLSIALYAWRRQPKIGARSFAVCMFFTAVYVLGYSGELVSINLDSMLFWSRIQYVGILLFPTTFLIFTIQYSGDSWFKTGLIPFFYLVPLLLLAARLCDGELHFFYASAAVDYTGAIPLLSFDKGPLYFVTVAYNLAAVTIGNYLLIRKRAFSSPLYNSQSAVIILAALFIYVIYIIYQLGITPIPAMKHFDYNPFAYSLWGAAICWAIFRHRMFDLVPIARDALIEIMSDAVIVLDEKKRIVDANPSAKKLLHLGAVHMGMDIRDLSQNGCIHMPVPFETDRRQGFEIEIPQDELMKCYLVSMTDIETRRQQKAGYLIQLHDITERKKAEKALRELSLVDDLTGLNNRRGFNMFSSQLINMAIRMHLSAVLFYLDMDRLKQINDNLGHAAGDAALKDFAGILRQVFRSTDVVSRVGGDEFVVFALESHGNNKAIMLDRMQDCLDNYNTRPASSFVLSCSVGSVCYEPESGLTVEQLLQEADRAMYAEKSLKHDLSNQKKY